MSRKLFLENVANRIHKNVLKETASGSGDISPYKALTLPLVKKLYTQMLTTQLFDVQPITSPIGMIAATMHSYKPTDDVDPENAYVITLSGSATAVNPYRVGDVIGFGASKHLGTVRYVELANLAGPAFLVQMSTVGEKPAVADAIYIGPGSAASPARTVATVVPNIIGSKKVFADYTGPFAYMNDSNATVKNSSLAIRTMTVETEARKIRTIYTQEQVQDFFNIYGEDAVPLLVEQLGNEISQEIDMETITTLKTIARQWGPLVLSSSAGLTNDLMSVSNDIYSAIFLAGESILRRTRRNRTMFVLCDSTTAGLLLTNPLHSAIVEDANNNPFCVGKIGVYPIYCDIFSKSNYCLVGYHGAGQGNGDSGMIYVPYTDGVFTTTSADDFQNRMMISRRYKLVQHPQDSGVLSNGDSDFFVKFDITLNSALTAINFPCPNAIL